MKSQDERYDIFDLLPVTTMKIWEGDDEREQFGKTIFEWAEIIGHPRHSETHNCCKTCGCATTCMYGLFFESLIETVIFELDRLGRLK